MTAITHSPTDGCTATTRSGHAYRGTHIILSVPSPLRRAIAFTPPLPSSKQAPTTMGFFAKATLVYATPWWRAPGLSAIFESALGPVIYSRATSIPAADHHSITGFIVGAPGRRWAALPSAEARRDAVLEQLGHAFAEAIGGGFAVPEPVGYVEEDWSRREWFGGGPVPVAGPGVVTGAGKGTGAEPVGGVVHFVGSETSGVWRGYMEGAVRSGVRGAGEVVKALREGKGRSEKL